MSDIDPEQAPAHDEAKFQEMVNKRAEQLANERFSGWQSPEDVEGLVKKRDELLGKVNKYKGISEDDIARFKSDQEKRSQDEIYSLLADGKHDEAVKKLTEPRFNAWNEQLETTKSQFEAAQQRAKELEDESTGLKGKLTEMQKRTYLKELVSSDDSFKHDYFNEFLELQASKMDIDPETGAVYALEKGKRKVDHNGDFVTFEKEYNKSKVGGLFWKNGAGTNVRMGANGAEFTGKPSTWDHATKMKFIEENGRQAYSELLAKSK